MLARLYVVLPFDFVIPEGDQFTISAEQIDGYLIRALPPVKSEDLHVDDTEVILVDDTPSFRANVLVFEFQKDSFDRRADSSIDPPRELLSKVLKHFINKMRLAMNGSEIRPIEFSRTTWRLDYLNDDGSDLEKRDGFKRGHGKITARISWQVINKEVWNAIQSLPRDCEVPPWIRLLLDARHLRDEVGPSIVLAYAALEVCIASTLDKLAVTSNIPDSLWQWINNRGIYLKEPSVAEQFDTLLDIVSGSSLKDEEKLWELFSNLHKARNSFVHEGVPKIGNESVTIERAAELIQNAEAIVDWLREKWPVESRWPKFEFSFDIKARKLIRKGSDTSE